MQKSEFRAHILQPMTAGLLAGAASLLLPLLAMGNTQATAEVPQLLPSPAPSATVTLTPQPTEAAISWDEHQTVRILLEEGGVEEMTLAEYLWRVVAAEMPASFEGEALRAQAVCARTYTLWKQAAGNHSADSADLCDRSTCCQAYITHSEAEAKWADLAEVYTARIANAVADTDGEILTYNGNPIQAVFFSSSTELTEDAAAVWGNSVPYLQAVSSPEREEVPNYRSTVTLTAAQLKSQASAAGLGANLSGDPSQWITQISYTASGRVSSLRLGGISLSGAAARALFGLRSACFEVEEQGGTFTFRVTGYGHGVGMSQYGANAMATDGAQWEEIVIHYFTGIEIEKLS